VDDIDLRLRQVFELGQLSTKAFQPRRGEMPEQEFGTLVIASLRLAINFSVASSSEFAKMIGTPWGSMSGKPSSREH